MKTARWQRWWMGVGCVLGLLGCGVGDHGELVVVSDMPVQPEVVTEATAAMNEAPSRSSMLERGQCVMQSDCPDDELCIAVAPGQTECLPASEFPDAHVSRVSESGRPVPPIGLLDGQAMRDHAERSMP
jgi:hypothetical protein